MAASMTRPLMAALRRFVAVPANARQMADIGLELRAMQKPTSMQRQILVWGRVFKSLQEVPDRVSQLQMKKAYDVFRIQVCMVMFVAGVIASYAVIHQGRQGLHSRRQQYDPQRHQ
jgi:hypothetical protein